MHLAVSGTSSLAGGLLENGRELSYESSHILGTAGGSWAWEEESHEEAGGGPARR